MRYLYQDQTLSFEELKLCFRNVSFPAEPSEADLAPLGVTLIPDPVPTPEELLAQAKADKLAEIRSAFAAAEADGFVVSSLGFRADATRRSIGDIEGLIDLVSSGVLTSPVTFRDYDNAYHQLSLDQLNILRLEAKGRGPLLYARKWELETAVDAAETVGTVQAVDTSTDWPGVEV